MTNYSLTEVLHMGVIVMEVVKGTSMIPVGKVEINEIGHLTPQNTING